MLCDHVIIAPQVSSGAPRSGPEIKCSHMRIIQLLMICLLAPSVAHSQLCEQPDVAEIRAVTELHKKIALPVESVPTDTAKYIDDEIKKSVQQSNPDRFLAVTGHQFYRAWSVHGDIEKAVGWLDASQRILERSADKNAIIAQRIAASLLLKAMDATNDLMVSIDLYVNFDRARPRPLLKASDPALLMTTAHQAQARLIKLVSCLVLR